MARHLLVTNDFPPKTGGIQTYLHELWRRLESGRAVVLTASSHPGAVTFDAATDLVVERVATSTLFLPTWRAYRAIEAAIARHDPELVLLDPAWPLGLLGPRLSRPYGVILHGAEVTIPSRLPVVASSLRYVLRRAKVAICAGPFAYREARRNAAETLCPVIQIPPGADTALYHPLEAEERREVRRALGFSDEEFLVASWSRLVPRKGFDTLIRASAQLSESLPRLRILIGGEGRDRARLEKLAARLDAPVTFLGYVPDEDQSRWVGACDLMVMDCRSRWFGLEQEGFGIVFVEGAAAGLVPVAGRSGGSQDAVLNARTGVVVENPRSVSELADVIAGLVVDDEGRRHLARNALEAAREVYDWDRLAVELARQLEPYDRGRRAEHLA